MIVCKLWFPHQFKLNITNLLPSMRDLIRSKHGIACPILGQVMSGVFSSMCSCQSQKLKKVAGFFYWLVPHLFANRLSMMSVLLQVIHVFSMEMDKLDIGPQTFVVLCNQKSTSLYKIYGTYAIQTCSVVVIQNYICL